MEIVKFLISFLLLAVSHTLIYRLGRSSGYRKGSHEGFMHAKRAYDAREKALPYLHDTIPKKKE